MQNFCSSGSKFSFSMKQHISSEITPVSNSHTSSRQVMGLKFSTEFSFTGFFLHSTVLLYVIQDSIPFVPSSISFNLVAILSCILSDLFIQNTIISGCLPIWHFAALFLHFTFINHHILLYFFHHFFLQITQSFAPLLCFFSTLHI